MRDKRYFAPVPLEAVSDKRLTALDHRCLAAIAAHDGMSLVRGKGAGCYARYATLAELASTDVTNFCKSLGKLVSLGYILTEPSPSDRRKRVLRVKYRRREEQNSSEKFVGDPANECLGIVGQAESENGGIEPLIGGDYIPLNGTQKEQAEGGNNSEFSRSVEDEALERFWSISPHLPRNFGSLSSASQLTHLDRAFSAIGRNSELLDSREKDAYSEFLRTIAHDDPDNELLVSPALRLLEEFGSLNRGN